MDICINCDLANPIMDNNTVNNINASQKAIRMLVIYTNLFERQVNRALPSAGLLLKGSQQPVPGVGNSIQRPHTSSRDLTTCTSPEHISRKLELGMKPRLQPRQCNTGCEYPTQQATYEAKYPLCNIKCVSKLGKVNLNQEKHISRTVLKKITKVTATYT